MQKTQSGDAVIVLLASSVRGRRPTLVLERRVEDQFFRIQNVRRIRQPRRTIVPHPNPLPTNGRGNQTLPEREGEPHLYVCTREQSSALRATLRLILGAGVTPAARGAGD